MGSEVKKIVFVVDGGFKIGLGHVYQSITLAQELTSAAEICFLTKSDLTVVNKIKDAGFVTHKLASDFEILGFLQHDPPNIVIFDKIDVSAKLAKEIKRNKEIKLVIFTNLTNANRYADVAITADIGKHYKNIQFMDSETNTLYFYGPKYWILREEFYDYNKMNKAMPTNVDNILVAFGGSDSSNLTTLAIKELMKMPHHSKIDVILGASFRHFESLNRVLEEYKANNKIICVHKDVTNVAELMFKADLVIASPGLSAFEALCVGTPILVIPQDLLQREEFQGRIMLIDKEDIAGLMDKIVNMSFTYPDQENIVNMHIGEGKAEIIKAVLGLQK